jgi:hypothetical protein
MREEVLDPGRVADPVLEVPEGGGSMRTVWKFPFEIKDRVLIQMPEEAEILLVECQQIDMPGFGPRIPTIWAEVNTEHQFEERAFYLYGTGHKIPAPLQHIASFQHGQFVWHLYE